jgi:hypothetical protein
MMGSKATTALSGGYTLAFDAIFFKMRKLR